MSAKFYTLMTDIGAAKLASAAALGIPLKITQMAVGDGGGSLPTPDAKQTALVGEQRRAALNMLYIDPQNSSQIIAEQVIPETEGGWWIREVGLFDESGALIAVGNCPESYKPQLAEGSGRTQTVRMVLITSSTDNITLKIDPSVVLATRKYVDDGVIEAKVYADSIMDDHEAKANPHNQYPLIENALKEIIEAGLGQQLLENIGLLAMGIGAPVKPLDELDWQTFSFVPGAQYVCQPAQQKNAPEDIKLITTAPTNINVVGGRSASTALILRVTQFTTSATAASYLVTMSGNTGNRKFTVIEDFTSASVLPVKNGGLGATTVEGALKNLQLRESFSGVVGQSRNARMSITTESSSATFTADSLIVETSDGKQYRLKSFNSSVKLSVSGAGGMDAGTVPAEGFVALYAIYNPTTGETALLAANATATLAPEIYGGENMPAGYTASALVSVWRVSSSKFTFGEMMGRRINTLALPLVTVTNSVATLTELSVSAAIPRNAKTMEGWGLVNSQSAAANNSFGVSSKPYQLGFRTHGNNNSGLSGVFSNLMLAEPQKIYYQIGFGGTPTPSTIYATGYSF